MDHFNLNKIEDSKKFYENRYSEGYMDYWPEEDQKRVFDIIINLNLDAEGDALDFGCGNGIFTQILKQALPRWNVYGTDLSDVAIENASKAFPECTFFSNSDKKYVDKKFNFIFSHHVFEHVYNIDSVIFEICFMAKEKATMLHILPCGNLNSYEHNICLLREDGINTHNGNRFFFEDEGHIRRLKTEEFIEYFQIYGFNLINGFYCNHYYGAINWISNTNPSFIFNMFNPLKGKNFFAKLNLFYNLLILLFLFFLRAPTKLHNKLFRFKKKKKLLDFIILSIIFIPYLISKFFDTQFIKFAEKEYTVSKNMQNGSEMYLYIAR